MDRIKRATRSPGLLVAVIALVAAVAGSALAEPIANTSAPAKKIAKNAKKKAKKALKQAQGNAGLLAELCGPGASVAGSGTCTAPQGPKGDTGNPGADGADGADGPFEFQGGGNLDATSQETILTVPAIDLEIRTDGDDDDDLEVRLHNAGTTSFGRMFPGEGNVGVITPGGDEPATAPGDYGATYVDGGVDLDTYDGEERLDAVVFKGPVRVWVECLFPIDNVLCRATVFD